MKLKKIRFWLASKILGGLVVEEYDLNKERDKWEKEQLALGNTIVRQYEVHTIQ